MVRSPGGLGRAEKSAPRLRGCIAGQGGPPMAMITDASLASETEAEGLAFAREVLRIEAEALDRVRDRLGVSIARAADLIFRCPGGVIVTGMGKAGHVGQKLPPTPPPTGTRALPPHPAQAGPRDPRPLPP